MMSFGMQADLDFAVLRRSAAVGFAARHATAALIAWSAVSSGRRQRRRKIGGI